jgi:hypothetical protein
VLAIAAIIRRVKCYMAQLRQSEAQWRDGQRLQHENVVLGKDLTLVDRDAVRFLEHCEAGSITLKPPYIREWIVREGRL